MYVFRPSPLLHLLGLLVSGSCAGTTWHYKHQMHLQYQALEQRFHTITNRYLAASEEARLVRIYYPRIIELHAHGILGQERRLDWIETLKRAGEQLDLPAFNYRIGVQTEFTEIYQPHNGNYRIYYSPMQLGIDLLHEGELRALFAELDRQDLGIYSVSSCKLSRLRKEINRNSTQGQIRADCELLWFNIRKQDGGMINFS